MMNPLPSKRSATDTVLFCMVCFTLWVGVYAQDNCACSCCIGYGCSLSSVGDTTTTSCDQDACHSAYPTQCPSTGSSGSCIASSISTTASSSYGSASGAIALDTSSVSAACKSDSSFQCSKTYSVGVSGSSLTLTSTSGTANDCAIGAGTIQDNGASAVGSFEDSDAYSIVATNEGDYISVNVDNGACVGNYYVTSGGPILGVSKEASKSSGSLSYAAAPLIALSGLAVMAVGVMA